MGFARCDYDGDGDLGFHIISHSGSKSTSQSNLYRSDISSSRVLEYITGSLADVKGFFYDVEEVVAI
jgi:hypothetical protein